MTKQAQGLSLIEIGLVFVISTIALFPIISMVGGKAGNSSTEATMSDATNKQSQITVASNSLMENALAGRIQIGNNVFASDKMLPPGGTVEQGPFAYDSGKNIWYKWVLRDFSYKVNSKGELVDEMGVKTTTPVRVSPQGNRVVQATLKMYNGNPLTDSSLTPQLVMPTYVYQSDKAYQDQSFEKTGIAVVVDISGSMMWASDTPKHTGKWSYKTFKMHGDVASPWLKDRYHRKDKNPPPGAVLDMWNDKELDITFSAKTDDSYTDYDETYLARNILNNPCNIWAKGAEKTAMEWLFNKDALKDNRSRGRINYVCEPVATKQKWSNKKWENMANWTLSRIEATRSALLALIVTMESSSVLADNSKLGLATFSTNVKERVAMSNPELVPIPNKGNKKEKRFKEMREKVVWFNREDVEGLNRTISVGGGTNVYDAVDFGRNMLVNDTESSHKILIFMTDGRPSNGKTSKKEIVNLCKELGKQDITMYNIGLIGANKSLMTDMANATKNGQSFFAKNVSELRPIFEQIAYQLEKTTLLNMTKRYNYDFST